MLKNEEKFNNNLSKTSAERIGSHDKEMEDGNEYFVLFDSKLINQISVILL